MQLSSQTTHFLSIVDKVLHYHEIHHKRSYHKRNLIAIPSFVEVFHRLLQRLVLHRANIHVILDGTMRLHV